MVDTQYILQYINTVDGRRKIMMKKLILTDVDGVLLNWEDAFHSWMESKGFKRNAIASYDMHVVYNKEKAHIKALIRELTKVLGFAV